MPPARRMVRYSAGVLGEWLRRAWGLGFRMGLGCEVWGMVREK